MNQANIALLNAELFDDQQRPIAEVLFTKAWRGTVLEIRMDSLADRALRLGRVCLFRLPLEQLGHGLAHGEGFQMLAQSFGELGTDLADVGRCPDAAVYRISPQDAPKRYYNQLTLQSAPQGCLMAGFAACQRFSGYFTVEAAQLCAYLDLEHISLPARAHLELEPLFWQWGPELSALQRAFAEAIAAYHPPRINTPAVRGWCSWYHYYEQVTREDIEQNLTEISRCWPDLRWVQIDDGYQAAMGDWLTPSDKFAGGVSAVIDTIHQQGMNAGIWVAPFIAQAESALFQQHPDWFVKDESGQPLPAERITYGGWRCTPWYMLDATQAEVRAHLRQVFATMRHHWGVRYFKLDANFWGAPHQVGFAEPDKTRVEAYRLGMQAIRQGAGEDAILLGCNAPMWPSLGLVDAMRVSDDVERSAHRFEQISRENLLRRWQHRRLWLNDPDCVVLEDLPRQQAPRAAYRFHIAATLASGGLLLCGERMASLSAESRRWLALLLEKHLHDDMPAHFDGFDLRLGWTATAKGPVLIQLNWSDQVAVTQVALPKGRYQIRELLRDQACGTHTDRFELLPLAGTDGAIYQLQAC